MISFSAFPKSLENLSLKGPESDHVSDARANSLATAEDDCVFDQLNQYQVSQQKFRKSYATEAPFSIVASQS